MPMFPIAVFICACLFPFLPAAEKIKPQDPQEMLVSGNTTLALKLYRELASVSTEDLILGPHSISQALALVQAGSAGETKEEIDTVMGWTKLKDQLHPIWKDLAGRLANETGGQFSSANRLYITSKSKFLPDYLACCKKFHAAEPETISFIPEAPARQKINAWVSEQTKNRIPELLKEGSLSADTRAVLVNACYFLGKWQCPFPKKDTEVAAVFHGASGDKKCALMHQTTFFAHTQDDLAQVVQLPYGQSDRPSSIHMLLVVPRKVQGLSMLEKKLDEKQLTAWTRALKQDRVQLSLPRFTSRSTVDLISTLKKLGMQEVFDKEKSDLSRMGFWQLFLAQVVHEAWISTDEVSTEAAAATGIIVEAASIPQEPIIIRADHPFLYVIRETKTGAILFIGRVMKPQDPGPAKP